MNIMKMKYEIGKDKEDKGSVEDEEDDEDKEDDKTARKEK